MCLTHLPRFVAFGIVNIAYMGLCHINNLIQIPQFIPNNLGKLGRKYKAQTFSKMIEEVIDKAEGVKGCCAVSRESSESIACIALYHEYKGAEELIEEKICNMCESALTAYMRLTCYEFLDALSLTVVGKVKYRALE